MTKPFHLWTEAETRRFLREDPSVRFVFIGTWFVIVAGRAVVEADHSMIEHVDTTGTRYKLQTYGDLAPNFKVSLVGQLAGSARWRFLLQLARIADTGELP